MFSKSGTFRPSSSALRSAKEMYVFLFQKMLLITSKKKDESYFYRHHVEVTTATVYILLCNIKLLIYKCDTNINYYVVNIRTNDLTKHMSYPTCIHVIVVINLIIQKLLSLVFSIISIVSYLDYRSSVNRTLKRASLFSNQTNFEQGCSNISGTIVDRVIPLLSLLLSQI